MTTCTIMAVNNWLIAFVPAIAGFVAGFLLAEARRWRESVLTRRRVAVSLSSELNQTRNSLLEFSQGPQKGSPDGWESYVRQIAGYHHGGVVFDAVLPDLGSLPSEILPPIVAFYAELKDLQQAAERIATKRRTDIYGRDIEGLKNGSGQLATKAERLAAEMDRTAHLSNQPRRGPPFAKRSREHPPCRLERTP
jgi:hypothetical protein